MNDLRPRPKRRVLSRLLAHFTAIAAGLFYIVHPPITTTTYLDAVWPARTWGVFFVVGGIIGAYAWSKRLLTIKRVGLVLEITALAALLVAQTLVMGDQGITWTRGGTVMTLLFAIFLLASYWQDILYYEDEAERAEGALLHLDVTEALRED